MSACIHANIVDCDLLEGYFYPMLQCLNELAVSVMSLACVLHCTLYIHAVFEVRILHSTCPLGFCTIPIFPFFNS